MDKNQLKRRPGTPYSAEIRELVIMGYLSGASRKALAREYNIYNPTIISHWIRNFREEFTQKEIPHAMKQKPKSGLPTDSEKALERENALLRKKLAAQESALSAARLRARAYEKMIELAEESFSIAIRKKPGSKQ